MSPRKRTTVDLPVLPLRGMLVFPNGMINFDVGRPRSIAAVEEAMAKNQLIFLTAQKDENVDEPGVEDLYAIGTVCRVMQVMNLPDENMRVLAEGLDRAELTAVVSEEPSIHGRIRKLQDAVEDSVELEATVRATHDFFEQYARISQRVSPEIASNVGELNDPSQLADLLAANVVQELAAKQALLEELDVRKRLESVCLVLAKETEVADVEKQVQARVRQQVEKNQKEYYLREQLRAVQHELGDTDAAEVEELRERMEKTPLNEEARQKCEKELDRLSHMAPGTPEIGMTRTYIEWILDLPWGKTTTDNLDLNRARKVLSEDHYGLDKVKERIIEYLAVLHMKQDMKGPILCFVGPPGVGKTSIVRAIARAVGRKFVQMSLGGVRDEAEIRGHRRTYIGAIPGRIISGLKQAGTENPVFLFDEIDKMASDVRGDPASAMLEVLDAEQNNAFRDHYMELPFDLSKVMFITTANSVETIPGPLLDRMELIEVPSYT